ncbi:MAG: GlxA family transcriptional regulator [Erythrobacter sp.]
MPASAPQRPVSISLIAVPEVSAAIVLSLHEVFAYVGVAWEAITGDRFETRAMAPRIVGRDTKPLRTSIGAMLVPDHAFSEMHRSDVVIVGDLFLDDGRGPVGRWSDEVAWIQDQYDRGAIVCSVCTGSMMLAEAGLLDNLDATTHWSATQTFADCYPRVVLQPERLLVPGGQEHRVVTTGGSASWTELALYLVARFCGEAEARRIAKIFLFGDLSHGQMPFAAMVRPRQHDDEIIAKSQQWIADHYAVAKPVSRMASKTGLAERTFKRRFAKSTGYTPLEYVQSLRIEEAKHMLETTDRAIDEIALEVGYEDPNSFRRLFKRTTNVTPSQYRLKFQSIAAA